MEDPGTAWDIEALDVARDHRLSMEDARNQVILHWLRQGDMRPFADWIMCGHVPCRDVLLALSVMMTRGDNSRFDPAGLPDRLRKIAEVFPLSIKVAGREIRGGNLANGVRDRIIAREVAKEMARGLTLEKAVCSVTGWLAEECRIHLGTDAVEKAYKNHKDKVVDTKSRKSVP